jgi:hypothetical protein
MDPGDVRDDPCGQARLSLWCGCSTMAASHEHVVTESPNGPPLRPRRSALTDRGRALLVALGGAALAFVPALALRGFTVDDALITARSAHHLAIGQGAHDEADPRGPARRTRRGRAGPPPGGRGAARDTVDLLAVRARRGAAPGAVPAHRRGVRAGGGEPRAPPPLRGAAAVSECPLSCGTWPHTPATTLRCRNSRHSSVCPTNQRWLRCATSCSPVDPGAFFSRNCDLRQHLELASSVFTGNISTAEPAGLVVSRFHARQPWGYLGQASWTAQASNAGGALS